MKYNPIKTVKAWAVILGRNSVAKDNFYDWSFMRSNKIKPEEGFVILPSKRRALNWVKMWKNHEDFTIVPITFKIPEAN